MRIEGLDVLLITHDPAVGAALSDDVLEMSGVASTSHLRAPGWTTLDA